MSLIGKLAGFFRKPPDGPTGVHDFTHAKRRLTQRAGRGAQASLERLVGHFLPDSGTPHQVAQSLSALEAALQLPYEKGLQRIEGNFNVNGPLNSRRLGAFRTAHQEWNDQTLQVMGVRQRMLNILENHVPKAVLEAIRQPPKTGK